MSVEPGQLYRSMDGSGIVRVLEVDDTHAKLERLTGTRTRPTRCRLDAFHAGQLSKPSMKWNHETRKWSYSTRRSTGYVLVPDTGVAVKRVVRDLLVEIAGEVKVPRIRSAAAESGVEESQVALVADLVMDVLTDARFEVSILDGASDAAE